MRLGRSNLRQTFLKLWDELELELLWASNWLRCPMLVVFTPMPSCISPFLLMSNLLQKGRNVNVFSQQIASHTVMCAVISDPWWLKLLMFAIVPWRRIMICGMLWKLFSFLCLTDMGFQLKYFNLNYITFFVPNYKSFDFLALNLTARLIKKFIQTQSN